MARERNQKPKCKGIWKAIFENGAFWYKCTKCGERITSQQGRNATNHKDQ